MSALAQFDLFAPADQLAAAAGSAFSRADRPPVHVDMRPRALFLLPDEQAPAARPPRNLSGLRAFAMKQLPIWTKRAALIREGRPQPVRGAERVAGCLELVVKRLALEACAGDTLAALKLRRDALEPHPHPRHPEIIVFGGPLMDEVRQQLDAEISAMEAAA